jgi:hypothetical protein
LVVAEAALLSGRSADKLRIAGCFATLTYAIARTSAIWPRSSIREIVERHERCNQLIRGGSASQSQVARRLEPIWSAILEADSSNAFPARRPAKAIRSLREARANDNRDEHLVLIEAFAGWSEIESFVSLNSTAAEERVRLFDSLVAELSSGGNQGERHDVLAFMAGYVATVAAGGTPSIGLAEQVADRWPEVLAWAYVIGGIGESITWTSSFQGLGRLISRELMRPFHLDEPPQCDFAFIEASYLVDRQLSDPLVHLQIKQQRVVTVALFPGVNVSVPLPEVQDHQPVSKPTPAPRASRDLEQLAASLWPLIEDRLRREGILVDNRQRSGPKKKPSQPKLPLK